MFKTVNETLKTLWTNRIMFRCVFSRFLDLRGNLGVVKEKPARKTCFSHEKMYLPPRICQRDFIWQEVWWVSVLNYFSLMQCLGISANLMSLIFFRALCKYFIEQILIITVVFNETANESTIYSKLCRNVTIIYRQWLVSLCQVQEKLRACRNSEKVYRVAAILLRVAAI